MGRRTIRKLMLAFLTAVLAQGLTAGTAFAQGHVDRLAGSNRYDTMSTIVQAAFSKSEWAVVACGESFPDSLSASALAGAQKCPVILTPAGRLGDQARSRLIALGVNKVYLMGGEAAVSAQVEKDLKDMGIQVTRVSGPDRTATSVASLRRVSGKSSTVIIATGKSFADSLAISPWSYKSCSPIVLTNNAGKLSDEAVAAIREAGYRDYVIVGGTSVVSDDVKGQLSGLAQRARLGGSTRYATATAIVAWERTNGGMGISDLCVTMGQGFADALAGTSLAGSRNSVMALVSDSNVSALQSVTNGTSNLGAVHVLGGQSSVSPLVYNALAIGFGQQPETGLINQGGRVCYYDEYGALLTAGLVDDYVIGYDGTCHKVDVRATGNNTADAQRVARVVAAAAGPRNGRSDFERVAHAAFNVSCFCERDNYTMSGPYYNKAYGVFIAREYSCAGSTRALGMVLDYMGYAWSHANENAYTHQWNILTLDGKQGYADGMGGFAGYGEYPGLHPDADGYFTVDEQPAFYRMLDLGIPGAPIFM